MSSTRPTLLSPLRPTVLTVVALAAATVLTACSSPATPEGAPGPETVTLYTSEPQEKIDEIVTAFNEQRPDVAVEVFRAGTGDLTARIEAERTAGEPQADVLLAADAATFEGYAAEDLLLELQPSDIEAIDPDVVDPEGYYVGTRIIPTVIAYHTGLVAEADVPRRWADLTDPRYAEQIVMPNPDVSGAAAYNAAVWLAEDSLGEPWLEGLAANRPVVADSNGPVSQAVASGAQPVGVVVDYLVRELAAAGSPVAVSYPEEGVPFVSQPVGIFAATDAEEGSRALVDFLLSAEGQQLAVEQSYLPVREDVGTPEGAPPLAEIAVLAPPLETIQATQDEAVARFNELLG